jgi:hypothetical protein
MVVCGTLKTEMMRGGAIADKPVFSQMANDFIQ